ncbi:MBL fold metallo-hydrolase [Halorientalis brevis]|uniref:MBL fold metallo-hydrolase n=1 Tax=Halorientalis brevis TaxID=1126241 RepID=A0ABD6CB74_9EURY
MKRIQLDNTFFEGQNNAYLFDGDGPTTLVDTGVAVPATRTQLEGALDDEGLSVRDLDQVLLTHWHADHAGLAGDLQAECGATVLAHPADAPLIEQDEEALAAMRDQRDRLFEEWGIPDGPRDELLTFLDGDETISGNPPAVTPLEPGETIAAGSETLEPMHLPGHSSGLTGFVRETADSRDLLSGDALLPEYTPNVGGADIRVERALEKYLGTLDRIATGAFDRAWPGHRHQIQDPTSRARAIIAHHRERTERVLAALDAIGPADPWAVSAELFGDLSTIHILHGPGEAHAHLEHLLAHDVVERSTDGYVRTEPAPAIETLFPEPGENEY